MSDAVDMSTPVTRGELREELQQFRDEMRGFHLDLTEQLSKQLAVLTATFATKTELEMSGGALSARITSVEHALRNTETTLLAEIARSNRDTEARLLSELARHTQANREWTRSMIAAIDDKYQDLPGRVGVLEGAVLRPRKR